MLALVPENYRNLHMHILSLITPGLPVNQFIKCSNKARYFDATRAGACLLK
jgi:hypothetical protein